MRREPGRLELSRHPSRAGTLRASRGTDLRDFDLGSQNLGIEISQSATLARELVKRGLRCSGDARGHGFILICASAIASGTLAP
jgi:hypothetical protein